MLGERAVQPRHTHAYIYMLQVLNLLLKDSMRTFSGGTPLLCERSLGGGQCLLEGRRSAVQRSNSRRQGVQLLSRRLHLLRKLPSTPSESELGFEF